MATDKSQNMDAIGKKELGWLVPARPAARRHAARTAGATRRSTRTGSTGCSRTGTPYTLSGDGREQRRGLRGHAARPADHRPREGAVRLARLVVGLGQRLRLYARVGAQPRHPDAGDWPTCPAGTPVKLTFKSYWDIEWDYDYGFVMAATPGEDAVTYTSLASANGYSTPAAFNPNANSCQLQYGNGLTGTSGSCAAGTQTVDRLPAVGGFPEGGFLDDEYDLTAYAGTDTTAIRFSYSTDPGLARPGWFIDDIKVETGDGTVLYSSDFENGEDEPAFYNGGCRGDLVDGRPLHHRLAVPQRRRGLRTSTTRTTSRCATGRASTRPAAARTTATRSTSSRACCSGTRTRRRATATPARGAATPRTRRRSTRVPVAGATTPELNDAAFTAASGQQLVLGCDHGGAAGRLGRQLHGREDDVRRRQLALRLRLPRLHRSERLTGTDIALAVQPRGRRHVQTSAPAAASSTTASALRTAARPPSRRPSPRRRTPASPFCSTGAPRTTTSSPPSDLTYQLGRRRQRLVRQVRHARRADVQHGGCLHSRPEGRRTPRASPTPTP